MPHGTCSERRNSMLYVDYNWDLEVRTMLPDPELNTDRLEWKVGDLWQVEEGANGKKFLRKIDPLEKFLRGGTDDKG
jgi:hypothetical protein